MNLFMFFILNFSGLLDEVEQHRKLHQTLSIFLQFVLYVTSYIFQYIIFMKERYVMYASQIFCLEEQKVELSKLMIFKILI